MRPHRPAALLPAALLALALPAFAAAEPICDPAALFNAGPTYVTGIQPRATLSLDVNEDGILDQVVCVTGSGSSNGSVTVLLGQGAGGVGDGTFAFASSQPVQLTAFGITSGDFDEDGILDVAVSNYGSRTVSVLLGQGAGGVGDGTFASAVSYSVPGRPYGIATADFDEDGIADLVVADNEYPRLLIMAGQGAGGVGNGAFAMDDTLHLTERSLSVVTGDFNEDGRPDIACTINFQQSVGVFINAGSGAFLALQDHFAGNEPYDLLADDLDEDGIVDLIVGNGAVGGVAVLRGGGSGGTGDGTFEAPIIVGSGALNVGSVVAGDFDGDGHRDVIGAHTVGGQIYFLRGAGDGTLEAPVLTATGSWPIGLATGDFDEDGRLDLAVPNYTAPSTQRLAIWYGQCEEPPPPPPGPEPVLDDVRDVPNDQGGKVFVVWQRSPLDGVTGTSVTGYRVWRRIHPALAAARTGAPQAAAIRTRLLPAAAGGTLITYWEPVAQLPAQRLEGYGYTAATTQDSMRTGNPYTAFFVTALTADPNVFYDSAVDSGYSVDNLPPGSPHEVAGTYLAGQGFEITWAPVADPDVLEYHLHRGTTDGFAPTEENRIAAVDEPGFVDPDAIGEFYYKVAAMDEHENIGAYALLEPSASVGVGPGDVVFALYGTGSNPSPGGPLEVSFALEREGVAELRLLDLAGRVVASRSAPFAPGRHTVALAADRVLSPGVYFLTLAQGGQSARMKLTILR